MTHEDMARKLQAAGWRVQPPLTPENCKHERRTGSGSACSDGSGHMEWSCPDCGKHECIEFPPNPDRIRLQAWN